MPITIFQPGVVKSEMTDGKVILADGRWSSAEEARELRKVSEVDLDRLVFVCMSGLEQFGYVYAVLKKASFAIASLREQPVSGLRVYGGDEANEDDYWYADFT